MSLYTRLNPSEINEILTLYGLSESIAFRILSGGSENTNYRVTTLEGVFVLSICEQKSIQQATELALLLEYLADANFQTSKIIRTQKNDLLTVRKGKPILLKAYLAGEIRQDLSPTLLNLIGAELAQLHQVPAPDYLPQQLGYGIEQFHKVELYAADSNFAQWLTQIQAYIEPYLKLDLPKTLIHSDLFWSNVIIDVQKPAVFIMDFEEAAHYYRAFDIGMTIIGLCADSEKINLDKARHFLRGYQSKTVLTEQELKSLKAFTVYAGAAMTFWRHLNFNYTKPDPAMFDHYLGLKVLVDFMLDQDSGCFI